MPRPSAAAAVSDDDERPSTRSARGTSARASKSKSKPPTPEPEPDADGEDDGEDGETEFEVEEIVNHKKKMFENKHTGFYVKWKGFPHSDNSWISEADAEHSSELIKDYWRREELKKKAGGKGSARGRSKASSGRSDDEEETASAPAKPTRGRKSATASEDVDMDADGDADDAPPAKIVGKKRKSRGDGDDPDDRNQYTDMKEYSKRKTWSDIVERVDTVEKKPGQKSLTAYLILTKSEGGKRTHATAQQCRDLCPDKLFDFYEKNLKWREAEEE